MRGSDPVAEFAAVVAANFQELVKSPGVFVVELGGDDLFAAYLASFPDGTNPFFRKTTEHDCSTCKHFIRRVGGVVAIDGGQVLTVWDHAAEEAPLPYREVARRLRDLVRASLIADLFRVGQNETSFGSQQTRYLNAETGVAGTWNHLYTGEIPRGLRALLPDSVRGDYRTTVQVFERGLTELSPDAVATVVSLVEANSLYRGEEHRPALLAFQKAQQAFFASSPADRQLFVWANAGAPASRFRNTVIGTLIQDLSEGKDIEFAVRAFETKVAPQNYKRTTALITPGMVKKAMETIAELGLESALERRFAVMGDISVNDVKWVDGSARPAMKDGLADVLMKHAAASMSPPSSADDEARADSISIDDFVTGVLPSATAVEIFFKGSLTGNLMSLTAPVDPAPKQLFRWSNDFAWSYGGNVADSIKERVKKAGGKVDGAALRVSLSWFNYDDLDLHVEQPPGRGLHGLNNSIFFNAKRGWTGGVLDVDMNAGSGRTREAVENIVWTAAPPDGAYVVKVNNYCQRETSDPGFVVELEHGGKLSHFSYNKGVRNQATLVIATLHVRGGRVERVEVGDSAIVCANVSQEKWGLETERYVKVNAVTLSPNYWGDNVVGNKHTFFVLEGAKNDEAARGFYNEFLHHRLEPHRKVFEVIGDKTKCQPTDGQLSGLGFSSTKRETFLVRVRQGKKQRVFNVNV
jgi:hypothetical protein